MTEKLVQEFCGRKPASLKAYCVSLDPEAVDALKRAYPRMNFSATVRSLIDSEVEKLNQDN